MTTQEMRARAVLNRNCGLPLDAAMIEAAADVVDAATVYCVTESAMALSQLRIDLARLVRIDTAH